MKKKVFTMVLCIALVIAMAIPAFAANPRSVTPGNYISITSAMNGEKLNAYTEGDPQPGTRVTTYPATGSLTQQWIARPQSTDRYLIEPAVFVASGSPLILCNRGNIAYLQPSSSIAIADKQVKLINEGSGNTGIALVDRAQPYLALTATQTPMSAGGHSVTWAGSSGQNNQLWQ